jgi:cellulose synthase/poly-beta-1,6-N-acetylglucosamine synthase-like glycosyltransferase
MDRPAVDVVVPFRGDSEELGRVWTQLGALARGTADSVVVVDNGPAGHTRPPAPAGIGLVPATARASSYFARNRGAEAGSNPWIAFVDADAAPAPDLLDRLFDPPPGDRTGVIAGGVVDEPAGRGAAARFAALSEAMSQDRTAASAHPYAQTANAAFRRAAFAAAGGFRDDVRSGGDADLCLRLADLGWGLERRDGARVVHRSRQTLRALLRQRVRHGSGAGWLAKEHPGTLAAPPRRRLATATARSVAAGVRAAARGDRDTATLRLVEPLTIWAYELGRLLPNRVR